MPDRYAGVDNYGRPKTDYLTKLAAMNDEALYHECFQVIYQAARCHNNARADWHWMVDACYDEATRRSADGDIYRKAYDRCYAEQVG